MSVTVTQAASVVGRMVVVSLVVLYVQNENTDFLLLLLDLFQNC